MTRSDFNPFNPNSVVLPALFAGRGRDVLEICRKLSQLKHNMPASFYIHGERGIGKTALAKLIKAVSADNDEKLYSLNLLTAYYSVEIGQDLSSVLQASVNTLTDQMDTKLVDQIGGRLGELFKNGKFTIGAFGASVEYDGAGRTSGNEKEITIKDQTVSILSNILRGIKTESSKNGILLIIDETHNLTNLSAAASVLRNIATTLDVDNNGQVAFLLIGYDEDVDKFFSQDSSSRRMFDQYRLDVMPDDEAAEVLRKGLKEAEYTWDESALISNIKVAGGYPHSIQILGHNLIAADSDGNIDQADWNAAIFHSAQALKTKEFAKMYSFSKTHTERDKILEYIAMREDKITRKQLDEAGITKNIYKEIAKLKSLGAIKEDENKQLSLHSQLFRTAILFDIYSQVHNTPADTSTPEKST